MENSNKKKEAANGSKPVLVAVLSYINKLFTHNYCDTCGYTKNDVFITEFFSEAGLIQCNKCFSKNCH